MSGGGCGLERREILHTWQSLRAACIRFLLTRPSCSTLFVEMQYIFMAYINCCAICFNCAACTTPLWRHLVSPFLKIINVGTLLIL